MAATHNTVWRDLDPTAHAEVNCIRSAAKALQTISLSGCEMYSTCEPCPMCLSAIHWSKIDRVVFGATIADAAAAGFCELHMARRGAGASWGEARSKWKVGYCATNARRFSRFWRDTATLWNLLMLATSGVGQDSLAESF